MKRFGLDDQQAFELLVRLSQQSNTKLVALAGRLVGETATRDHPAQGHPPAERGPDNPGMPSMLSGRPATRSPTPR